MTRPNNAYEGDNSKGGMMHFIFSQNRLDDRDSTSHNVSVRSDKFGSFLSFCDIFGF